MYDAKEEMRYLPAGILSKRPSSGFWIITMISDDCKISACEAIVACFSEIHQNIIDPDDGMMMMRKIQNLPINAQESTLLEPKGYHIMFLQLKESLTMGASFPLTLTFEKTGTQTVNVEIIAPGSKYKAADVFRDHHNH